MSKTFKIVMAGLVTGTFLLGAPPAHAIFGIRAARTAIAARRANKAAADETPRDSGLAPRDSNKDRDSGLVARDSNKDGDNRPQTTGEKNPSLEEMKRLEQDSKKGLSSPEAKTTDEKPRDSGLVARDSNETPRDSGLAPRDSNKDGDNRQQIAGEENSSLEEMKRLEQESKKI